jgi:hypothetical protein
MLMRDFGSPVKLTQRAAVADHSEMAWRPPSDMVLCPASSRRLPRAFQARGSEMLREGTR